MIFHFYSPVAFEQWDWRNSVEQGIGGSETSHVEMAWRLARRGHEVHTYAPVPDDCSGEWRGTTWQPLKAADFAAPGLWVLYRCPSIIDEFMLRSPRTHPIWLMFQDWSYPDLTPERIARCARLITLCEAHGRDLRRKYPTGADRLWITSNGLKVDLLAEVEANGLPERDPHRIMYASSPDRGLLHVLRSVLRAREYGVDLSVHAFYGYNNLDKLIADKDAHPFAKDKAAVLEMADRHPWIHLRGRVDQRTLYREWLASGLWVYQTNFNETSCITCMEAQACGAIPIVNPIYALAENVRHGIGIEGDAHGDPLTRARFAGEIARASDPAFQETIRATMMADARDRFNWERFVTQWEAAAVDDLRFQSRTATREPLCLPIDADNPVVDALAAGEEWEPELTRYFAEAYGGLAIEVGAYVGEHTRQIAAHAAETWAFEPQPRVAKCLAANVAHLQNVRVFVEGAYDYGTDHLNGVDGNDWASGSSPGACFAPADSTAASNRAIAVRPLDKAWIEAGRPSVTLLKIDAEGCEAAVLRGATELVNACRPLILCERGNALQTARHGDAPDSAQRLLEQWGYQTTVLSETNFVAWGVRHPLLSVVTPSIRPEGLVPVWDCLKRQTYARWEWIIAVPAQQLFAVHKWVADVVKDARVSVIEEDHKAGAFYQLNKTWNRLFAVSAGSAIVSATDWLWFEDDALRKLAQAFLADPTVALSVPTNHVPVAPRLFAPLSGMVAAFDWGGTLSSHEQMRWLARNYKQAGARIEIVSAVGDDLSDDVKNQLRRAAEALSVPVDDVHLVRGDNHVPEAKVEILRAIGAHVFFDDIPANVEAACHVCRTYLAGPLPPALVESELLDRLTVDYGDAVPTWTDYRLLVGLTRDERPLLEPSAVELNLALLPRAPLWAVNGMDESYDTVAGMSEKDLAWRLRDVGVTFVLDKRIQARAIEHVKEWPDWDAKVKEAQMKYEADIMQRLNGVLA